MHVSFHMSIHMSIHMSTRMSAHPKVTIADSQASKKGIYPVHYFDYFQHMQHATYMQHITHTQQAKVQANLPRSIYTALGLRRG